MSEEESLRAIEKIPHARTRKLGHARAEAREIAGFDPNRRCIENESRAGRIARPRVAA